MTKRQKYALLLSALLLLLLPATAQARWGKEKCSLETHCYDLRSWEMAGGSESVKGAQLNATTSSMNVQQWAEGAHVTDEMWVGFDSAHGGWIETGQYSGYEGDEPTCCSLHPFLAFAKEANQTGYEAYVWNYVNAEPTNLYTIEDASTNAHWCIIIVSTTQKCLENSTYWPTYSDSLEAGIEAASSSMAPVNTGQQEVDAFTHSNAHIEWKGAKHHAVEELINQKGETLPSGVMCQGPGGAYGNASWSICE